jgi:hypothetical protein
MYLISNFFQVFVMCFIVNHFKQQQEIFGSNLSETGAGIVPYLF